MQFFCQHDYFRHIWASLGKQIREKKFELDAVGKDVTRYENIRTFNSFDSVPENRYCF